MSYHCSINAMHDSQLSLSVPWMIVDCLAKQKGSKEGLPGLPVEAKSIDKIHKAFRRSFDSCLVRMQVVLFMFSKHCLQAQIPDCNPFK